MTDSRTFDEPAPALRRRRIPAGEARVAVFQRTYDAAMEDVWSACTDPERLARWYVPVTGDLRVGGTFQQVNMGSGEIVACEPPSHLRLSLGGGADEIELWLREAPDGAGTLLELQHATTLSEHEIGGQVYDAIFCMGGGYYPRLWALDLHLRGELPIDWDSAAFHLVPEMRPAIERGSGAMQELLDADAQR
jgi:uncharacterized protein YndB with AHSA1/START domain